MPCAECQTRDARVRVYNLDNVQERTNWFPILLEVDGHRHKSTMVQRCPGVSSKVQGIFILLGPVVSHVIPRGVREDSLDITGDSGWGRDVVPGAASLHDHQEPTITHNLEWTHAFGNPSMGAVRVTNLPTLFMLKVHCHTTCLDNALHNLLACFVEIDHLIRRLDHLFAPAAQGMTPETRRRGAILCIEEVLHTPFALRGCTLEGVASTPFHVRNFCRLVECIDGCVPIGLQHLYCCADSLLP